MLDKLINTHCHTEMCGHAVGTLSEMIDAAANAGIAVFALTEHYPLSAAWDVNHQVSIPAELLDGYCESVISARKKYPQMEILLGAEVDWLGEGEDREFPPGWNDRFDFLLGSVHYVDGWPFDDPAQRDHWNDVGPRAIWDRYFEIWCQMAVSDAPFDYLSHPDLVKKFGFYPEGSLDGYYDRAAEAAAEGKRMIELNTSGAYYDCAEMFPAQPLLERFCKAGVPVTVGTDAHDPANVARDIKKAYTLLLDAGYKELTVPCIGGGTRKIPLV